MGLCSSRLRCNCAGRNWLPKLEAKLDASAEPAEGEEEAALPNALPRA